MAAAFSHAAQVPLHLATVIGSQLGLGARFGILPPKCQSIVVHPSSSKGTKNQPPSPDSDLNCGPKTRSLACSPATSSQRN